MYSRYCCFWSIQVFNVFTKIKKCFLSKIFIFVPVKFIKNPKYLNYYLLHYFWLFQTLNVSIIVKHYNPFNVKDNDLISKIKIKFPFHKLLISVELRIYAFYRFSQYFMLLLNTFPNLSCFYSFSHKLKLLKSQNFCFSLSSKIIVFIITPNCSPFSIPFHIRIYSNP